MGPRSKIIIIASATGLCAAVAIGAIHAVQGAERVRELAMSPDGGRALIAAPFPHVKWNPLAINGSGIGQTVSSAMVDRANDSFHMGGISVNALPVTKIGNWIYGITVDTRAHEADVHVELDGLPEHHHDNDHDIELNAVQNEYAVANIRYQVEIAYRLDPTNFDAVELACRWLTTEGSNPGEVVTYTDFFGNSRPLSRATFRAIRLYDYSLANMDLSKLVPDNLLAAAQMLLSKRLLEVEGGWTLPEKKELERLQALVDTVEALLARATAMEEVLKDAGLWAARGPEQIKKFEVRKATVTAYANSLNTMIENKRSNTRKNDKKIEIAEKRPITQDN